MFVDPMDNRIENLILKLGIPDYISMDDLFLGCSLCNVRCVKKDSPDWKVKQVVETHFVSKKHVQKFEEIYSQKEEHMKKVQVNLNKVCEDISIVENDIGNIEDEIAKVLSNQRRYIQAWIDDINEESALYDCPVCNISFITCSIKYKLHLQDHLKELV